MNYAIRSSGAIADSARLVEEARDLVPYLREMSPATNAARRPSEETKARLKMAGFARIFQPRRYGGYEGSLTDGVDALRELAHGCASTAWIVVQNMLHGLMLSNWSEQAQDEVWGAMPDALISGILIPGAGKAIKVDGGFRLSGRWPFVSGVEIADWIIFTGDCHSNDTDEAEEYHFLLRRDQVEVIDTWYTIGLNGSSSHDVILSDVFVPSYMTVTLDDLKGEGKSKGSEVNIGPLYRIPPYSLFGCFIGSAALGIAENAVGSYIAGAKKRVSTMSGSGIANYTTQQVKTADAQCSVIASRELINSVLREAERIYQSGGSASVEDRTRYRAMASYAGRLANSAVNTVLEAGGGGVIYDRNPVSRCIVDMMVANRHITQNWDVNASAYGRVLLGLPCGVPALED